MGVFTLHCSNQALRCGRPHWREKIGTLLTAGCNMRQAISALSFWVSRLWSNKGNNLRFHDKKLLKYSLPQKDILESCWSSNCDPGTQGTQDKGTTFLCWFSQPKLEMCGSWLRWKKTARHFFLILPEVFWSNLLAVNWSDWSSEGQHCYPLLNLPFAVNKAVCSPQSLLTSLLRFPERKKATSTAKELAVGPATSMIPRKLWIESLGQAKSFTYTQRFWVSSV